MIVDACIPPLFGYQPYEMGGLGANKGYVLYGEGPSARNLIYANNEVFESAAFPALLGLWAASGRGTYAWPAVFEQRLIVRPNTWFGVTSVREVTVVWFYLTLLKNGRRFLLIISLSRHNHRGADDEQLSQLQHAGHELDRHAN